MALGVKGLGVQSIYSCCSVRHLELHFSVGDVASRNEVRPEIVVTAKVHILLAGMRIIIVLCVIPYVLQLYGWMSILLIFLWYDTHFYEPSNAPPSCEDEAAPSSALHPATQVQIL